MSTQLQLYTNIRTQRIIRRYGFRPMLALRRRPTALMKVWRTVWHASRTRHRNKSVLNASLSHSLRQTSDFDELAPQVGEIVKRDEKQGRIPLQLRNGVVMTDLELPLVKGIDQTAFVTAQLEEKMDVVLGFESEHGMSHTEEFIVGHLCCERFVSAARCKLWWMTPEWGCSAKDLSPETQFLLMELREGGPYAVMLPLIDGDVFRATLRPAKGPLQQSDEMALRIESGDEKVKGKRWERALYISAGWDPYTLLDHAVISAAKLSGGAKARMEKTIPESLDAFGWCTWDAFYSTVSAKSIVEGIDALKEAGFGPKLLIIDDGWQMTDVDDAFREAPTAKLHLPKQEETGPECTYAEEQVIAETSSVLPSQTADVVMPRLTAMGPSPSVVEDEDAYDEKDEDIKAAVTLVQRAAGWVAGVVTSLILLAYNWFVDKAPPGSAAVRFFAYLANEPLRNSMLSFYATAGDFSHRLTSVRANGKFSSPSASESKKNKRTENLGEVVRYLKDEKAVEYIYFWHGLSAYWGGVSQQAPEMAKYNPRVLRAKPTAGSLEVEPSIAWNPAVVAGVGVVDDISLLYEDMHAYLKSAGASGVKVDAQAGVGLAGSMLGGGPAAAFKYHRALEESVERHFQGNHVMNCMCHSTENLYRMLNTAVARASDDFYPRDNSSATPHIASCSYNALFMSPLVVPDWDMFQSKHKAAHLHAAARAISGGAIYISDKPGQHDFEVLRGLVLADGSVLRPKIPARPTRDCLFRNVLKDGQTLLKVWSRNTFSGVVGVYNLQGSSWDRRLRQFKTHAFRPLTLETKVTAQDVEDLALLYEENALFNGCFAAYTMRRQKLEVGSERMCLCVELPSLGSEIVSFTPVQQIAHTEFAPIGFPHLLNGTGAIESCTGRNVTISRLQFELDRHKKRSPVDHSNPLWLLKNTSSDRCTLFEISLKGSGEFLCYASRRPIDVWIDFKTSRHVNAGGFCELAKDARLIGIYFEDEISSDKRAMLVIKEMWQVAV